LARATIGRRGGQPEVVIERFAMIAAATTIDFFAFADLGRPSIMGVLNVTPDSFSDGGKFLSPAIAIAHAEAMAKDGADILDVGAESTRPYGGAKPVSAEDEIARLEPVLSDVLRAGPPVSIDTMKATVARWALDRGVVMVNDVWGLQRDPDMARVVADYGAFIVVMHNRETVDPLIDIIADIENFFTRSLDIAAAAGVASSRIILDPGIGFGKTPAQSIEAIARLGVLRRFGLPILVGASRKRFIDSVSPAPTSARLAGSLAAHLAAAEAGAAILRVHDVAETLQALKVAKAIREAQ
jgi:dihydropteroate synthase